MCLLLILDSFISFSQNPDRIYYAPVDIDYYPVRKINTYIHVIQKDDGTGNITGNQAGKDYLKDVFDKVNYEFRNLSQLSSKISGNDITDLRIEIIYDESKVIFHPNTILYNDILPTCRDNNNSFTISWFYDQFVLNYPYTFEDNHLHIYLIQTTQGSEDGYVSNDMGLTQNTTGMVIRKMLDKFNSYELDFVPKAIKHELLHIFGLHEGGDCFCDDWDPSASNNNIMNQQGGGNALSECQAGWVYSVAMGLLNYDNNNPYIDACFDFDKCEKQTALTYEIPAGTHKIWNDHKELSGDIIVKSTATLEIRNKLHLPENARIFVEDNALLKIDGGTITNECGDLWKGIEMAYNGLFTTFDGITSFTPYVQNSTTSQVTVINNSLIENACIGITVGMEAIIDQKRAQAGGGMLWFFDSEIKNCNCGIVFYPYVYNDIVNGKLKARTNLSMIRNSSFICNNEVGNTGHGTTAFIKLDDVSNIRIEGNVFKNDADINGWSTNDRGKGIWAKDATFFVQKDNTQTYSGMDCEYNTGNSNTFEKLTYGIHAVESRDNTNKPPLRIYKSSFINSERSIELLNTRNFIIYDNAFTFTNDISDYYIHPSNLVNMLLKYSNTYSLISNQINFDYTNCNNPKFFYGILHEETKSVNTSEIRSNTFNKTSNGCVAHADYYFRENINVIHECNTISNHEMGIVVNNPNTYPTPATLNAQTGLNGDDRDIPGNTFSNNDKDIYNHDHTKPLLYHSDILNPPYSKENVDWVYNTNINTCHYYNECVLYDSRFIPGGGYDVNSDLESEPEIEFDEDLIKMGFKEIFDLNFEAAELTIDQIQGEDTATINIKGLLNLVLNGFVTYNHFINFSTQQTDSLIILGGFDNLAGELSRFLLEFYFDTKITGPEKIGKRLKPEVDESRSELTVDFVIYPNPAHEFIFIDYQLPECTKSANLRFYNIMGKLIHEAELDERQNQHTILLSPTFTKGLYIVKLNYDDYSIINKVVIK